MVKNEYIKEKVEKPKKKGKGSKNRESKLGKALISVLDGSILTRENAVRLVPFGLFLTFICLVYIANSYYADKTVRKIYKCRNQLKELECEYTSTKSELVMRTKQSVVADMLDSTGIEEALTPPKKIFVTIKK